MERPKSTWLATPRHCLARTPGRASDPVSRGPTCLSGDTQAEPCLPATRSPLLIGSIMRMKFNCAAFVAMCVGMRARSTSEEAISASWGTEGVVLIRGGLVQGSSPGCLRWMRGSWERKVVPKDSWFEARLVLESSSPAPGMGFFLQRGLNPNNFCHCYTCL